MERKDPDSQPEEASLWRAFRSGDRLAFRALYDLHAGDLLNYGSRLYPSPGVVEDCVQEVFIDLWQYRERLTDPANVRLYLLKSLRNRIGKHFRRENPFTTSLDETTELPFLIEPSGEQRLIELNIDEATRARVQRLLDQLTPRQRQIIYLRYFQDFDYEEICELMDIGYQTARSQHYHALKTLRSLVKTSGLPLAFVLFPFFI